MLGVCVQTLYTVGGRGRGKSAGNLQNDKRCHCLVTALKNYKKLRLLPHFVERSCYGGSNYSALTRNVGLLDRWSLTSSGRLYHGQIVRQTKIYIKKGFGENFQKVLTAFKQINSRIWEMKGGKYAKILAKIQVSAIFHMRDIR